LAQAAATTLGKNRDNVNPLAWEQLSPTADAENNPFVGAEITLSLGDGPARGIGVFCDQIECSGNGNLSLELVSVELDDPNTEILHTSFFGSPAIYGDLWYFLFRCYSSATQALAMDSSKNKTDKASVSRAW
jgi:hypothetical protein